MSWFTDFVNVFKSGFSQASLDQLVADIKQGVQTAESDLAIALAWIVSEMPSLVSDAQEVLAILTALTGNLTISASVLAAINVAIGDMQQFENAANALNASGTVSAVSAPTQMGLVVKGHAARAAMDAALAQGRLALNSAGK